ncbi:MAG: hypothetical protein M1828_006080 [Chrysothrix sp. TS-e1954]|nr:MAG: hypothetical protein M1828_006080 [Chrysothrix sp. TS-e1954]
MPSLIASVKLIRCLCYLTLCLSSLAVPDHRRQRVRDLPESVSLPRDLERINSTNVDTPSLSAFSSLSNQSSLIESDGPAPNDSSFIADFHVNSTLSQPGRQLGAVGVATGLTALLSNSTDPTDSLSLTWSRCATHWDSIVGPWTFLDQSANNQTTWSMIWNDGYKHAQQFGGFEAALYKGLQTNLLSHTARVQQYQQQKMCDQAVAKGSVAVEASIIRNELRRRLLQWLLRPRQAALIYTAQTMGKAAVILAVQSTIAYRPANSTLTAELTKGGLVTAAILGVNIFVVDWMNRHFQGMNRHFQGMNLQDPAFVRFTLLNMLARPAHQRNEEQLRVLLIASGAIAAMGEGIAAAAAQELPAGAGPDQCLTQEDLDNGFLYADETSSNQMQTYADSQARIQEEAANLQC